MLVGALLDAGAPEAALREMLGKLALPNIRITVRREARGSFAGTRFLVETPREHHHRHLSDILSILGNARLPEPVAAKAKDVFERIARAESAAHGIPAGEVHFHEVGAADTIVDIVGACGAFHILGIEEVAASAIELGSGTVNCDHGTIPVPAPGTIGVLLGSRVRIGGLAGERTTPTGAALVAAFASSIGEEIEIVPSAVGYGVGARETRDVANLLRVIVGEVELAGDRLAVLETNLDDTGGETIGYVIERALASGALDAFATAVTMKKGRPGFVVSILAPLERRGELEALLFRETPTLGVRRTLVSRSKLRREVRAFATPAGEARAKVRFLPDGRVEASAEFTDARRIAGERGIALSEAMALIESAARAALALEAHSDSNPGDSKPDPTHAKSPSHAHSHPNDHSHGHSHGHSHSHGEPGGHRHE